MELKEGEVDDRGEKVKDMNEASGDVAQVSNLVLNSGEFSEACP